MKYLVRYTATARRDLAELFAFIAGRDLAAARRARAATTQAVKLLEQFPYSCRTAGNGNPFLRELVVPFGHAGFVLLYRVEEDHEVTILAARHQREDDYF